MKSVKIETHLKANTNNSSQNIWITSFRLLGESVGIVKTQKIPKGCIYFKLDHRYYSYIVCIKEIKVFFNDYVRCNICTT
mgnify:CR=1 FL=1